MIKIIDKMITGSRKFVQFMSTIYVDMNGETKTWNWIKRTNETRAVVIAASYDDKLIITKEYRVPLEDYEHGMPAGLIDDNESIEDAARRELKEETGLDIDTILHVSPFVYNSAGLTNEAISIVVCTCKGEISQDMNEGSEDIETYAMSREEVSGLLEDNTKKIGAKAYLLMLSFIK